MDKTCSNCKYAIGFGPLHNKAIYAFCEKAKWCHKGQSSHSEQKEQMLCVGEKER